jgi:hypothetical protein
MIRRAALPGVLAVALVLAGCAPQPDLTDSAAQELQGQVLAVSTAAAGGSLEEALTALDAAEQELDAALAAEEVTPARYREIRDAIRLVRADLEAGIAKAQAEAQAQAEAEQAARDAELAQQLQDLQAQQAAEQAAAEEAAAQQAAEDAAKADEDDKDEGKGNGNGNEGNGNGNGKGKDG